MTWADGTPLTEQERAKFKAERAAAALLAAGGGVTDYRSLTDLYSRFDADGIPTHHADGTPLTEAERQALREALVDARAVAEQGGNQSGPAATPRRRCGWFLAGAASFRHRVPHGRCPSWPRRQCDQAHQDSCPLLRPAC